MIGTTARVPDRAAAAFSRFFYEALLGRRPLGESIVHARRELLSRYGNPLGALYVLHADPNIVIHDEFGERAA